MFTIYTVYLHCEPFLCLSYMWLVWRIKRSKAEELQSPFFKFFVYCGVSACANVIVITLKRFEMDLIPWFFDKSEQDIMFNLIVYISHSFSCSHTIGKTLVLASRFTAICFPLKNIWTVLRVNIAVFLMFLIPACTYSFMIPPKALYRNNTAGLYIYEGVEQWAQQLSKLISAASYIIFILISFPMCIASIYQLRQAQRFNPDAFLKHERALLFYAIAIAGAHLIKSAQQIFWYSVIGQKSLFDMATSMYNLANALTTFVPPLLLISTSRVVRYEVAPACIGRRFRYNPTVGQSFRSSSTQERQPSAPQPAD